MSKIKSIKQERYGFEEIDAVTKREFMFDPEMPVSKSSKYGDSIWDWNEEHNSKAKILSPSKVRINWDSITIGSILCKEVVKRNQSFAPTLPPKIVEDIKRAVFLYIMFPQILKKDSKRIKGITAVTFTSRIVNFFSFIYTKNLLLNGRCVINAVSDIKLSDIRSALEEYPYNINDLKNALTIFASDHISENLLYGKFQWNKVDIKNLPWGVKKDTESIKPLPDDLFRLLSDHSRNLILEFLFLLGEEINDADPAILNKITTNKRFDRFVEMFDNYLGRRQIIRHKGAAYVSSNTKVFKETFGIFPEVVKDFLFDVHCAAQTIILLYTGMRYSEAAFLQGDCLIQRDKVTLIKSRVIKNRPTNLPIVADEWIAIHLVQDAVKTLQILSECIFNKFLFANFDTVKEGEEEEPLSNIGLTSRLNKYLSKIDTEKQWVEWLLSTHQFRHGLIWQLARAEVGIPYITRQLHHFHSSIHESSLRINEASTVYGLQKERLIANATGLNASNDARREVMNSLYGEGRKFAGGGKALHVERTEAFFKGCGLSGKSREQYIAKLAEAGITPIRTGVGWCTRNHLLQSASNEGIPDCIGDLNCNPHDCKHSVVSETRKPDVIRMYLDALQKLQDPEQFYQKKRWEKTRDSLAAMLEDLDVDVAALSLPTILGA